MVSIIAARQLALELPEVEERSHFEKPDFRVGGKIFASLHEGERLMMVKLNPVDQSVFCAFDSKIIYPVPGGWGKKGATFINLAKVPKGMLRDALRMAWRTVASKRLLEKYFRDDV